MCKHEPKCSDALCPDGEIVPLVEDSERLPPAAQVTDPQEPDVPANDDVRCGADSPASPPGTANFARPWPPRVYDFLTGGSEYFRADAAFGRQLSEAVPWLQASMWINKRHRTKAALTLAQELGIRQIIDLGCGYPSHYGTKGGSGQGTDREYIPPHTADVARTVHQDARVVYADIDNYVYAHAKTVLDEHPGTTAMQADARDIPTLLARDEIVESLDLDRPIGVIVHDVLPWLTDDEAALTMRHLHELLPASSAVSLTHATGDDNPEAMAVLVQQYAEEGFEYRPRTLAEVSELLGPWTVLDPGIQQIARWRDGQPPHVPPRLRTTWHLPPEDSHAYAAVTAPKVTPPEPASVIDLLRREPPRPPGNLLVGATLQALREEQGISTGSLAESLVTTSRAIGLWEAGGHRLANHVGSILRGLDLADYQSRILLERLLPATDRPWDREHFSDTYPGNWDRAVAVLRAAKSVRVFVLDRIPDAFHTPGYAALFPPGHLIEVEPGRLPSVGTPLAEDTDACTWDLVLDEVILDRAFGHPHVLAEQLHHLLHLDTLPHITVRVLRLDSPLAMPVSSITEHVLEGGTLWRSGGFTYSGLGRGQQYPLMLDRAVQHAAPEAESRALLEEARDRMYATYQKPPHRQATAPHRPAVDRTTPGSGAHG
ncbi:Scr1 family TA system antitoxin-like transcriptional regulator [Streptomyces sp. NPDC001553]|uniref:Scr1 family TA system antitoxin-like transcriptional regulator n=1 Tax=Streptomyces sp. NPDC001553 TaxID=3154385 RepID=UPI00331CB4D1